MSETPLLSLLAEPIQIVARRLPGEPADLLPDEVHYVRHAVAKRVAEFAAGRACARIAMARLGFAPAAIATATDRSPVWPVGLTGSITHTDGWCAAAVARSRDYRAIGIDTEVVGAPIDELWEIICTKSELAWVMTLPLAQQRAAVTLLFSVKEAFYKCQYPLTYEWLEFHDLSVAIGQLAAGGEFTVCGNRPLRIDAHWHAPKTGRFVFHDVWVSAAVSLAATGG